MTSQVVASHRPQADLEHFSIQSHFDQPFLYIVTLLFFAMIYTICQDRSNDPFINPRGLFELTASRPSKEFIKNSKAILEKARSLYPDQPFRVYTDWGESLVIPPSFVNELKSHPDLDFLSVARDDSHGYIPGWEPFQSNERIAAVLMKHLTKTLNKLTKPLSTEATAALQESLGDSPEWHEIKPARDILWLISRLSSRIFVGEELCRNKEWINAAADYTVSSFTTGDKLREWPRAFRPFVHWFMPEAIEVRKKLDVARRALQPFVDQRRAEKAEALDKGQQPPVHDDALEWFEKEYAAGYDPAISQITLSLVAIHTTSDLLQNTMYCIARHPELFPLLRQEVMQVFSSHGLTKVGLYDLKLMDSVIKEAQRTKPVFLCPWRRWAFRDIKLSNGYTIRKGTRVLVSSVHMQDSQYYENPDQFDSHRFLRMRDSQETANQAHLVSASEHHLGFGHGQHACPGRFFAANEIKIALCHLLLKYDWKLPEGHDPQSMAIGMSLILDPHGRLLIKRRKEEVDIDTSES